jgi:hypothetical protein
MRTGYKAIAHLIALGVVLEASFIAYQGGTTGRTLHEHVGMELMPLLGLALLVVAFLAKFPGAVGWAGLTLLAILVQVILAVITTHVGAVGALHGINAFVVLGLAEYAARRATITAAMATPRPETAAV